MDEKRTQETANIKEQLAKTFPQVSACRYNSASIRVRVIDSRFGKISRIEREKMILSEIEKLDPETQADISVLLLLAPDETDDSLMNMEFENPTPSTL